MKKAVCPHLSYDSNSIPFLKNEAIEAIALNILKAAEPSYTFRTPNVPILSILDQLQEAGFLQLNVEDLGYVGEMKVRGKTLLKQNQILLDIQLASSEEHDKLYRMTAAHELGHWVLHRRIPSKVILDITDTDKELGPGDPLDQRLRWLEGQAKTFAAALLLPRTEFIQLSRGLMQSLSCYRPNGKFYLDYHNIANFIKFKSHLSDWFGVSDSAVEIRLKKLDMIEDNMRVKSAGEILREAIR